MIGNISGFLYPKPKGETMISDNCTGCGACMDICPHQAISMKENAEGFLYPEIDSSKCIGCGLCDKVCPANNPKSDNAADPVCYAAAAHNSLRLESSSGAVFPLLAEQVLSENGVVCGAAFEDNIHLKHILISDLKDLKKLKGSKYLQSDTRHIFSAIKDLLEKGKYVLFSGTPCQVAGLNLFLRKKYDTLITVDVICHGTPSPKVWRKYLDELKSTPDEQFISTNFRDKSMDWESFSITCTSDRKTYTQKAAQNPYYRAFLSNLSIRKSCTKCPVIGFARHGDITLGDFWKINKYNPKLNDQLGTSCVLLNSPKGEQLFSKIQSKLKFCERVPLKYAKKGNPSLTQPSVAHPNRDRFFSHLDQIPLKKNLEYTLDNKYDCAILNFWYTDNYGAILTCWALQEQINEFNLTPKVIRWIPRPKKHNDSLSDRFSKFLNLTTPCYTTQDLRKLNDLTNTFIVGSDQVWRYAYSSWQENDVFWLSFAKATANKIAYAASFGSDEWEGPADDTDKIKYFMSRLNAVSVREDDGVDICKNTFNAPATHVLDPVFLIDPQKYDSLIQESKMTETKLVSSYLFQNSDSIQKSVELMKKKYPDHKYIPIKDAYKSQTDFTVPDFLYTLKNCDFFITDSFHGACFAIIFNKPFICFANRQRGFSRFKSLFNLLGLSNQCVLHEEGEELEKFFKPIDYEKVNTLLAAERNKSKEWLLKAITDPKQSANQDMHQLYDLLSDQFEAKWNNLTQYPIYRRKYLKYKILSFLTLGKIQKKFRKRRAFYKQKMKTVKNF